MPGIKFMSRKIVRIKIAVWTVAVVLGFPLFGRDQ